MLFDSILFLVEFLSKWYQSSQTLCHYQLIYRISKSFVFRTKPVMAALGHEEQKDYCPLETSLICIGSSWPARTTE